MSLKDMPNSLLREYHVTPVESGVMGSRRHLSLSDQVTLLRGVLYVEVEREASNEVSAQ